jgi:hypothetical protein
LFGGAEGTTSKLPEEIDDIPEEELAAAPVSVVKKESL